MSRRAEWVAAVLLALAGCAPAQQVADLDFDPTVARPAYASAAGPRVVIDAAHHNFHTVDGRYRPFAELLRRDGYRVDGSTQPLSATSLQAVDVLVIANPLHARNEQDWSLPTPCAFTWEEIAAVRTWVEDGGALLLIADHMPFPGAAGELARAFGVEFSNGYAQTGAPRGGIADLFEPDAGLRESAVTRGRAGDPPVTRVATFGGSAFRLPEGALPVLQFGAGAVSRETRQAPGITPDAPSVPIEGWCQAAVLQVDRGRVAIFGEAAMFSAQVAGPDRIPVGMNAPEAAQNHQLLLNTLHWLTRAEGMPG